MALSLSSISTSAKNFINNLSQPKSTSSSSLAGIPQSRQPNPTVRPSSPSATNTNSSLAGIPQGRATSTSSLTGIPQARATSASSLAGIPQGTRATPLPPAGQTFVSNLTQPTQPVQNQQTQNQPTTPITQPKPEKTAKDKYLEYLNSADVKTAAGNVSELSKRSGEELLRARKEEDVIRENKVGQLESGLNNRLTELARKSNKSLADIAIAKGYAVDTYNQLINMGADIYDAERAAEQAITDRDAPIEIGGFLYQRQPDGSYIQVAGTGTGTIADYNLSKQQGYTGTYDQWLNEDANRKAKSTGSGSLLTPYQQFQGAQSLASGLDRKTAAAREIAQYGAIINGAYDRYTRGEAGDLNATSQAIINSFSKILDPSSVVRETEYARSGSGQSLLSRIEGAAVKLAQGGAGLTPAGLKEFVDLSNVFVANAQASIEQERQRALGLASQFGISTDFVGGGYVQPTSDNGVDLSTISDAELERIANGL